MDEIIEKPSSFSDESEEIVDQPDTSNEPLNDTPEVVGNDKVVNSKASVATVNNSRKIESCTVVLPESRKPGEGSFMSYLLSHPLLLLLAVVCLVAVVYLILDFLRGFFPWMQN